jgi:Cu2+-exporting ATPase
MREGHSAAAEHTMHHHQHDARSDDSGEAAAIGTALPGAVVHDDHAHDPHAGHSAAMFRRKFWISLALTIPILMGDTCWRG